MKNIITKTRGAQYILYCMKNIIAETRGAQ